MESFEVTLGEPDPSPNSTPCLPQHIEKKMALTCRKVLKSFACTSTLLSSEKQDALPKQSLTVTLLMFCLAFFLKYTEVEGRLLR